MVQKILLAKTPHFNMQTIPYHNIASKAMDPVLVAPEYMSHLLLVYDSLM